MSGLLTRAARLDRAILIRHAALCLATAATFLWPFSVPTTNRVIWIVALVISINFVVALMWHTTKSSRAVPILSISLGVFGWLALGSSTGGTESPFIAGFGLEILLSAMTFPWLWTLGVGAAAMLALLAEWSLIPSSGSTLLLGIQCSFLGAMGVVTALLSRRWQSTNTDLLSHQEELERKLTSMEKELKATRESTAAEENSARLAHGIKNAVHALRGFAALAREPAPGGERSHQAWDGLCACIDRLDETTRFALRRAEAAGTEPSVSGIGRAIEEVIREASLSYPGIRWQRQWPEVLPCVAAPATVVREALLNLVRNAAEATGGEGEVIIEARIDGSFLEIAIRDHGAGIAPSDLAQLFVPGRSTKPDGSGLGLFLTRRLVEAHGGFVRAVSTGHRGARFSMGLPVLER